MRKLLLALLLLIPFKVFGDIGVTTMVGLHIPTIIIPSIQLSYKQDKYSFGLVYGSSTFDYDSRDFKLPNATFTNKGIYTRYFIGNSFNIIGSLNQRTIAFEAEAQRVKTNTLIELTSASVGFGNYWVMKYGVTFGIDYLLLSTVLDKQLRVSTNSTSEYIQQEEEKGYNNVMHTLSDIVGWRGYFLISVGFTF